MSFQTTLFLTSDSASGSSSNFTVYYSPPIELDTTKTYELALISANLWRSWHNVTPKNNKFRYSPTPSGDVSVSEDSPSGDGSVWVDLAIPPGAYNVTDINAEIKRLIKGRGHDPDSISLTPNYSTQRSRISLANNYKVDFRDEKSSNNLRSLLGFKPKLLSGNGDHDGDTLVDITSINSVVIRCSLINSSYINGSQTDIIHSFSPDQPPGYLLDIQPRNLIYLPINKQSQISQLTIRITDQAGREIDLHGERTTFYISLREQT